MPTTVGFPLYRWASIVQSEIQRLSGYWAVYHSGDCAPLSGRCWSSTTRMPLLPM